jgi:hypothetical protein
MSSVVPWPVDGQGFVNLHYSIPKIREPGGKDSVIGKPYQNIDDLIRFSKSALTTTNIKEQWFCTSLQAACSTPKRGSPKAVRSHQNTKSLKAIWADVDVKDGG